MRLTDRWICLCAYSKFSGCFARFAPAQDLLLHSYRSLLISPMAKRRFVNSSGQRSFLEALSRRRFIQFASTASLAAVTTKLIGCAPQAETPDAPAEGTESASPASGDGQTLRILSWPGYEEPEVIGAFEEQYGVKVEFKTYIGGEQMLQFFNQSPPGTFDALISDGEYVQKLVALGAIAAIKPEDVPDLKDYTPVYQEFAGFFENGEMMAVGTRFGNYGIAYNKKYFTPEDVASWEFLLREDLAGKLAIFDWYLPNMGNASLAVFPDNPNPYDLTDAQLEEVKAWMLKMKPNVSLVTPNVPDIVNAFINEDVTAGPVGDWVIQNAIADGESDFTAVVPKEGAIRWSEGAAVCKDAQNPDLALAWVQYMSTPEVQARLANAKAYKGIAPNLKAVDFLSDSEKELLGYVPDPETPDKLLVETQLDRTRARQLPVQQEEKVWQDIYNEFKTS
jgi:spermidine/putrescine transport system substrate-binding protein